MCGICGIVDFSRSVAPDTAQSWVKDMNHQMHHRGPDFTAHWNDELAHLGFKRLSIIGLNTGNQPIFNEDRSIAIIFNGEIYNYIELRESLLQKGHQFYTDSDTEVLVHLYEEEGTSLLKHVKGMFAFCLYDMRKKQFFFARDRFGEKPFYYSFQNGFFAFSSELNSLLACARIPRKLNQESLGYFLKMGMTPEPLTLFDQVFTLPSGHFMLLDAKGMYTDSYFDVDYRPDPELKSLEDAKAYIRPFLTESVKRQMRSDVPFGAFLSGGIDSSSIVALMQEYSDQTIKTFNVRFEDSTYDESPIARKVAEHVGTDHHEITIPNADFNEEIFWHILDHTGVPFTDTSAIPTHFITREIRKHVKVALSGDGGDELFAGYPIFHWWKRIHQLKVWPGILRKGASQLLGSAGKLPGLESVSTIRQLRKALDFSMSPSERIPMEIMQAFDADFLKKMKGGDYSDFPLFTDFWKTAKDWSPLRQIMYFRLKYNLPLNLLPKVDRMSMGNSLEVRAPFLDPDLFEASTRLPDRMLLNGSTGKFIIRELMQEQLPQEVFDHPKMGFAIPLHRYMNDEYRRMVRSLIRKDHPLAELFDWQEIERTMQIGLNTQKDSADLSVYKASIRLWLLLALFGWMDRFKVEL